MYPAVLVKATDSRFIAGFMKLVLEARVGSVKEFVPLRRTSMRIANDIMRSARKVKTIIVRFFWKKTIMMMKQAAP